MEILRGNWLDLAEVQNDVVRDEWARLWQELIGPVRAFALRQQYAARSVPVVECDEPTCCACD